MKKRRNTLIFAALVVFAALAGLAAQRFFRPQGAYVAVNSYGREIARLPLSKDAQLVTGGAGQGSNRICVKDGAVFVQEADCPDQICVREGKKRQAGDVIACLPHELILVIHAGSAEQDDGADAYAW